ncbi:MAG: pectate lyase [Sphingobacteriales bacterium]|jgi:PelA/Pel-15E family pectate lyase|nr:pectate lyase [Sphingobacteriales bacterium]
MKNRRLYFLHIIFWMVLGYSPTLLAQRAKPVQIDPKPFGDNSRHWYGIYDAHNVINSHNNQQRYLPTDVINIANNILLYQKNNGGWPKNYDVFAILTNGQKDSLMAAKNILNTTFDNGTTYTHIHALAIAYSVGKDEKHKTAAINGLQFILDAQYNNGGWPQYYPLKKDYSREITFNDGNFEGILKLLKSINDNDTLYSFIDENLYKKLEKVYYKGIDCILKTQIIDNGKLTAWAQQYNEETLQPVWARKFEPPGICNGESTGIVLLLMSIKNPNEKIIRAIQCAVKWFEASKILNTRVETIKADSLTTPYRKSTTDRVVVIDSTAPPIWARYYEISTQRPLFCNRDGKLVYSLAEVERERRDGYAWYTYSPQKVLDKYLKWQQKWVPNENVLKRGK